MWPYEEIAAAFRVKHVMTPWEQVLAISGDLLGHQAAEVLQSKGFDFAPCTVVGEIVGIVERQVLAAAEPSEFCRSLSRPLRSRDIVEAEAHLADLIHWLLDGPFYLVIRGKAIAGIVHLSDLNRAPVRTYFHLLLTDLEMGLSRILRAILGDGDQWAEHLSEDRRLKLEEDYRAAQKADQHLHPLDHLYLSDYVRIAQKEVRVSERIGVPDGHWKTKIGRIVSLRNQIAHPVRDILREFSVRDLIDIEADLHDLISRIHAGLSVDEV